MPHSDPSALLPQHTQPPPNKGMLTATTDIAHTSIIHRPFSLTKAQPLTSPPLSPTPGSSKGGALLDLFKRPRANSTSTPSEPPAPSPSPPTLSYYQPPTPTGAMSSRGGGGGEGRHLHASQQPHSYATYQSSSSTLTSNASTTSQQRYRVPLTCIQRKRDSRIVRAYTCGVKRVIHTERDDLPLYTQS